MVQVAARFITLGCPNHNHGVIVVRGLAVDQALSAAGFFPAHDADRMKLGHIFSAAQKLGHGAKGFAAKVHVQPGHNHSNTALRHLVNGGYDAIVEKLHFVNGDDGGFRRQRGEEFLRIADGLRLDVLPIVAGHVLKAVTVIETGFKHLRLLFGDDSAAYPANQFLRLAAEHTPADDLNTPGVVFHALPPLNKKGRHENTPAFFGVKYCAYSSRVGSS